MVGIGSTLSLSGNYKGQFDICLKKSFRRLELDVTQEINL